MHRRGKEEEVFSGGSNDGSARIVGPVAADFSCETGPTDPAGALRGLAVAAGRNYSGHLDAAGRCSLYSCDASYAVSNRETDGICCCSLSKTICNCCDETPQNLQV